ncbi:quinone-dependent dihydroorotate dehydrogenase [Candidatus Wolfebacteria bacterium]|nr:quinone-dependent dihydroorotate dehydrogenase [Candidatus Wolfebacteria bacterium]
MRNIFFAARSNISDFFYKFFAKQIFFRIDPETVHERILKLGKFLGGSSLTKILTSIFFNYSNKVLEQEILGIKFKNPVGLAAGFDKDAELTDIIGSVGFGFEEVGSITGEFCGGNEKPRLWRLKKSKSLVVNYGLKNQGCEKIAVRLRNKKFSIPVGVSIAKTNCPETADMNAGINDYFKAHKELADIGDYTTINISCPNAFGGQPFHDAKSLNRLLVKLAEVKTKKPTFIKLSPDLRAEEVDSILEVAKKHNVAGFICSNLTKNRENKKIIKEQVPEKGGISGKAVEDLSNDLIRYIYKKTKGEFVIVGCGGISSAKDAYEKIKSGATLLQLITGMIYEGPQIIGEINRGLVKLLKKDGFSHISEAMGIYDKK